MSQGSPSGKVLAHSSPIFPENLLLMTRDGQTRCVRGQCHFPLPMFSTLRGGWVDSQRMGKVESQHHRQEVANLLAGRAQHAYLPRFRAGRGFPAQPGALTPDWGPLREMTLAACSQGNHLCLAWRTGRERGRVLKPVRLALESFHWAFGITLGLGFLISKEYTVHDSYLLYCGGLALNP